MTISSAELARSLDLFEFAPGKKASWQTLKDMLPDVETALFFAKVYNLTAEKLGQLVLKLFRTPVTEALLTGDHSTELQDYIVDVVPDAVDWIGKSVTFNDTRPHAELLPEFWAQLEVTVASSIKEVAEKIGHTLDRLPSKEGAMTFGYLNKLNRQRHTIGDYRAVIRHDPVPPVLVILDVSGSMTAETIRAIAGDVVAMSWDANAYLAIVSNTCRVWDPGTFNVDDVLREAEYAGTHYEQLAPLFDGRNWGTVITIADYDSSRSAKQALAGSASTIEQVIDVSLVNRPTFLAECVGQLANKVTPILVGNSQYVVS